MSKTNVVSQTHFLTSAWLAKRKTFMVNLKYFRNKYKQTVNLCGCFIIRLTVSLQNRPYVYYLLRQEMYVVQVN